MIRKLLPWFDDEPQLSRRTFLGWTAALGAALALPRLLLPAELVAREPPIDPTDLQALIDATWKRGGGTVSTEPGQVYELRNSLLMRPGVNLVGAHIDFRSHGDIRFPRDPVPENQCVFKNCYFTDRSRPHFNLYDLPPLRA